MRKISLKTWPEYFKQICMGTKTFEIRKNDRSFEVGDILIVKEWNPSTERYTGNLVKCSITYIIDGDNIPINLGFELKNACVMSIKVLEIYIQV